jgi:hypothetical protein
MQVLDIAELLLEAQVGKGNAGNKPAPKSESKADLA